MGVRSRRKNAKCSYLKTADSDLIARLDERLESGNLKIIPFPNYTQAQIRAFEKDIRILNPLSMKL